jgi:hypothetical protein
MNFRDVTTKIISKEKADKIAVSSDGIGAF